jgi:SPP1 gp7 family putative phage head morphogenesis protein
MVRAEQLGMAAQSRIYAIYQQAQKEIEQQIDSIYRNYAKNGVLSQKDLQSAIGTDGAALFKRNLKRAALRLGVNPNALYDERYLYRLSRLDALKRQVELEVLSTAPLEEGISRRAYRKTLREGYAQAQKDHRRMGIRPTFSTLNDAVVDAILNSKWEGGNYSTRIWGNTTRLAKRLPRLLGGALVSGQNYQKTISIVRERFDVRRYEAARLVRTETDYLQNQVELQSLIDDGIEKYEYQAILDRRTSKICEGLNGDQYLVSEAVAGVNFPPMHVHCRSGIVAVYDSWKKDRLVRATDGRIVRFSEYEAMGVNLTPARLTNEVKIVDTPHTKSNLWGQFSVEKNVPTITLDESLTGRQRQDTLYHELGHYADYRMGMPSDSRAFRSAAYKSNEWANIAYERIRRNGTQGLEFLRDKGVTGESSRQTFIRVALDEFKRRGAKDALINDLFDYMASSKETFADAYRQFVVSPKTFSKNNPQTAAYLTDLLSR